MNRNLDGCYFRIKRDGAWQNICFGDLTTAERDMVCQQREASWYKSLAYHLADKIKIIGNQFDIYGK